MDLVELTPRLHVLRFSVGQAYLWRDGNDLTLVDTGPAGSGPAIADVVQRFGTLRRVVLTHFHDDHAGSAAEVASWPGVTVLAHRDDAPIIRGERQGPPPDFTEFERELHSRLAHGLPPAPPARVDVELTGGERLDIGEGARVVHVPGHTDGSIGLHLAADGVLFTGDVIAEHGGELMLGPFNLDRERAAASLRVLAGIDADIACFGHGDAVVGVAGERLQRLHG
jgi:glyoxylase-like metal-dependent hydrolase (beta-lactamase superfamily II)